MTLDWPLVTLALGAIAATVVVVRPFVMSRSTDAARASALEDVSKRLNAVEAHLASGRRMPGALR